MITPRSLSPIIKVVSAGCNLRCKYCFYAGQQNEVKPMDLKTLESVTTCFINASPRRVRFQWHGGEPLLMGIDFYEEAVAIQNRLRLPNQKIINSVQTNGTLINQAWADFFKRAHFEVGVSLDGPEDLHDFARYDARGQGSFQRTMRGMNILRNRGIKFGTIAVINNYSVLYPREIYEFFSEQGIPFSPNACIMRDSETDEPIGISVDPIDYAHFLIKICDMWLKEDNPRIMVRPLVNIIQGLLGVSQALCEFRGTCEQYLTIDSNGDVYPCERFLEKEFCFGNLANVSLDELTSTTAFQRYYARRLFIAEKCCACKWFSICGGGCLRHWTGLEPDSAVAWSRFCGARQLLFKHVEQHLTELGYITKINDFTNRNE